MSKSEKNVQNTEIIEVEHVNEEVYPNGSMLSPDVITTCNDCNHYESGARKQCTECESTNIEIIREVVQ